MSGYRDDAASAKQREALLREELQTLPPVKSQAGLWLVVLLLVIGTLVTARWLFRPQPLPARPPIAGPPTTRTLRVYSAPGLAPIVTADVIVLPMWNKATADADRLYLVGFDVGTHERRWTAGPWASEPDSSKVRMLQAGESRDYVAIVDTRHIVHGVTIGKGSPAGTFPMSPGTTFCRRKDGTLAWGNVGSYRILGLSDNESLVSDEPGAGEIDCRPMLTRPAPDDTSLLVGVAPDEQTHGPRVTVRERATSKVLWTETVGSERAQVDHDAHHLLTREPTEIALRNTPTSRVLWRAPIAALAATLTDDRVYVVKDHALVILDIETGKEVRALSTTQL